LYIYNERYVVERLIESVCRLDYPRHLLEIQVLDDSTDDTINIARFCAEKMKARGFDMVYLHRKNRTGYKAGALKAGLKVARGDLVAIFDADFVPDRTFLMETIPYFTNPHVGMLQTRWGHLNSDYSMLTRAQSIGIDGHFSVEQASRAWGGLFMNFNGTAGIWRKKAIEDAGGWQADTLTEDLDLSYRAQLKGWKLTFAPGVVCPAEVPVTIAGFKSQQDRWKGKRYTIPLDSTSILEFILGLYSLTGLILFLFLSKYLVSPFLMIYTAGFFSVFFLSIKQSFAKIRNPKHT
jgi:cellulose synthase/poly-beta-1,6-N-acetylglucosamine synthase-like glycosyltransferase